MKYFCPLMLSTMRIILNRIAERMGIEPSSWQPILVSIIGRISAYIGPTDTLP